MRTGLQNNEIHVFDHVSGISGSQSENVMSNPKIVQFWVPGSQIRRIRVKTR